MSDHNTAVYNNTCIKIPRNPVSQQPSPIYEQKFFHNAKNQARKLSLEINNIKNRNSSDSEKSMLKSLIEFYGSIPEYGDVHHLSNKDFYRKLNNLKEKQRSFYEYTLRERQCGEKEFGWVDDYKQLHARDQKFVQSKISPKPAIKQFCATPTSGKPSPLKDETESLLSWGKRSPIKPPSRRSVRIETPSDRSTNTPEMQSRSYRLRPNISSAGSKTNEKSTASFNEHSWDDFSVNNYPMDSDRDPPTVTRSAPTSPTRQGCGIGWKENGITIPKPFQMTVRDEENKIVEEVISSVKKPKEEKLEMFKANPVPIESRIPLFNKIIADQERRSEINKQKSRDALVAQMRPFSFTRREEEIKALTSRLSRSYPSLFLDDIPINQKRFRAKPVPRGLFSNYIYQKMHEDEFYRALQRKIRAEELFKASSLPPSMAKREKGRPKPIICPRSFKDLEIECDTNTNTKSRSIPNYSVSHYKLDKELEDLKGDYVTTSPRPFKLKTAKRSAERRLKRCYGSSTNSSSASRNADNFRARSAAELLSINKSNLAAVLRIQSAKKKMEMEMGQKLEEAKLRDESRWREKVLRKKPAWQALAYSNEEDLNMRLQLRRDEERMRNEEHHHQMQLMYGRVNRMPMLFERKSEYNNFPVTRNQLISKLKNDYHRAKHLSPSLSISDLAEKNQVEEILKLESRGSINESV